MCLAHLRSAYKFNAQEAYCFAYIINCMMHYFVFAKNQRVMCRKIILLRPDCSGAFRVLTNSRVNKGILKVTKLSYIRNICAIKSEREIITQTRFNDM